MEGSIRHYVFVLLEKRKWTHSKTLGLGEEPENESPTDQVPGGVVVEGTLGGESTLERRPCQGQDTIEEPTDGDGVRHANVTDVEREGLGTVGEWHGTLRWRVEDTVCVKHMLDLYESFG